MSTFSWSSICLIDILRKTQQRKFSIRSCSSHPYCQPFLTLKTTKLGIFFALSSKEISTQQSQTQLAHSWHVKQTRIHEQYNLTVSSRISIRTNTILYLCLSSQNFDLPKGVSCGHSLTLVQKRKIRLKWEDLHAQFTLWATTKWLQTEIFVTMAGAVSQRDCVIFKRGQWDFRKDYSPVNSEHISQLNGDNSLPSRAWESHCNSFDTRMSMFMYILQSDLLVVRECFRAATCQLGLCC